MNITRPTSFINATQWQDRDLTKYSYYGGQINIGEPFEIADGVFLLRLPLPFALNHINVYLIKEDDGWTLIDCGLNTSKTREIWDSVLAEFTPLNRIVVTHHHPDHIGLAGWLSDKFTAPILMTEGENEVVGRYSDPDRNIVQERSPLWLEHGLPADKVALLIENIPNYTRLVTAIDPARVEIIDRTKPMQIGKRKWIPIIGRGHAPDHLSLLDENQELLIGGDQVLPEITPNIAVWPGGDQNPLRSYFITLQQFVVIKDTALLLPSHHQPLYGVSGRTQEIYAHHEERLGALWDVCAEFVSAIDIMPALFGRQLQYAEMGFGLGEAIAHLNYLESEGLLQSVVNDDAVRMFKHTSTKKEDNK